MKLDLGVNLTHDVILSGAIPKIAPALFAKLEERDRSLRRAAKSRGYTHLASRPAKRVMSAAANRHDAMRRSGASGLCSGCKRGRDDLDIPRPTIEFVPTTRIYVKSTPSSLQHVPAKRLKCKSSSHLLYRRV